MRTEPCTENPGKDCAGQQPGRGSRKAGGFPGLPGGVDLDLSTWLQRTTSYLDRDAGNGQPPGKHQCIQGTPIKERFNGSPTSKYEVDGTSYLD